MIEADKQLAKVDTCFEYVHIVFMLQLSDKCIIIRYFLILHTFNKYITCTKYRGPSFSQRICIFLFKRLLYLYLKCHYYK